MPPQPVDLYSPLWRFVASLLRATAAGSVLFILGAVVWANDPPVTPPILFRMFAVLIVVPATAAYVVHRAFAGSVSVGEAQVMLQGAGLRIEIPRSSLASVRPWRVPVPGPGVSLHLPSGRRFTYGVQLDDPRALLAELGDERALQHPTVAYAAARAQRRPRRWYHRVGRYPLFALLPTAVLFQAHQHIAYGGVWGEYYLLGLRSYLTTFAVFWSTLTIYVLLYSGVLRAAVEIACLGGAWVAPPYAAPLRRLTELIAQIGYYAGVPMLLALRFLPW